MTQENVMRITTASRRKSGRDPASARALYGRFTTVVLAQRFGQGSLRAAVGKLKKQGV